MKRKQVKKACVNCQKSHAACDDSRPCSRCITLNLANSCEDAGRRKKQKLSPTDSNNNPASVYMNSFLHFVPSSTPASGQPTSSSPIFVDYSPNSSSTGSSFVTNSNPIFSTKFNSETPIPQQECQEHEEVISSLKEEIEDLKRKLQQSEEESERWKVQCEKLFAVLRLRTENSLDSLLSDLKSATSNLQHVHQYQIDSPSSLLGPSSIDSSLFKNRNTSNSATPMTKDQISKLFAFCFEKSEIPISITGISGAADKVIACNNAFKKAFGLTTKPNVSDYTWKELLHPVFWRIMMQEWINFAQVNLLQYKTRAKCCHIESGKYFIMETQVDTICDENNIPLFNLNYIIGKSELFDEIPKVQPVHPSGIEFSIPPLAKDRVFDEQPLYSSPMIDMVSIVEKKLQNTNAVPPSANWTDSRSSSAQPKITQPTQHYIQPFAPPPQSKLLPSLNNLITMDSVPGVNSSFIPIQSLQQQQQLISQNTPTKLSIQQPQQASQQEGRDIKRQYPF